LYFIFDTLFNPLFHILDLIIAEPWNTDTFGSSNI